MEDSEFVLSQLVGYETRIKMFNDNELIVELVQVSKKAGASSVSDIANHKITICSSEILNRINGIDMRPR